MNSILNCSQTGMLRSRTPKFYDDDDDDEDEDDKNPTDHSGAGGINDKYGDYENDNAQSRDRNYDKPMKQHKNSFSSLSGLDDKLGKKHENDDFDRHPYQTSGGGGGGGGSSSSSSSSSNKADAKDAIKIISTPLGKVSIIYQSTNSTSNNNNKPSSSDTDNAKSKIFDVAANLNRFKSLYNNNNHNIKTNRTNNTNIDDITRQKGYSTHLRHNHHFHHYHNQHHNQQIGGQYPSAVGSAMNIDDPIKIRSNEMTDKTKLLPKQITPVLTADGKVALLYRGAQDSVAGQQLPKLDVTKNTADFIPNVNSGSVDSKVNYDIVRETEIKFHSDISPIDKDFNGTNFKLSTNKNTEKLAVIVAAETTTTTARTKLTTFAPIINTERPILKLFKSDEQSTIRNSNEEENSILPNINRPLSEVLGIKKNQFIQFRIPDMMATATPTPAGNQNVTEKMQISNINGGTGSIDSIENPNESNPNNGFVPNFDYDYYGGVGAGAHGVAGAAGSINEKAENPQENDNRIDSGAQSSHSFDDSTTISDVLSKTEVINLAIIPAFEGDLNRFQEQQQNDVSNDNNPFYNMLDRDENGNEISMHGRNSKHRSNHIKDLSALHCAMQTLVAIAALATVFGMLGAYYKQRILNQLTVLLTTIQDL